MLVQWLNQPAWKSDIAGLNPTLALEVSNQQNVFSPLTQFNIVGNLHDREVACSALDHQGSNFQSCVWRAMSSRHPQEVFLVQLSLHVYVHKGGLNPIHLFHFCV